MSCGNPSVEQDALMPRRNVAKQARLCVKCKEPIGSVFIRHAVYCKDCFFAHVVNKSRRCLDPFINAVPDKSRKVILKASGNLVVGFSGGLGSTVLLDFIYNWYFKKREGDKGGKDHPRNVNIWDKAYVCYVDWSSVFPETSSITEDVKKLVDGFERFEFVPVKIEDAFDLHWWRSVGGDSIPDFLGVANDLDIQPSIAQDPVASLKAYLSSLPTPTAFISSLQLLTRLILLHTANSVGASHLLLGTSLTSLAVSLISNIAQGGGYATQQEAQEEWRKDPESKEIRVLRPLRDVGMKECAIWAYWRELKVIGKPKIRGRQGIGILTKDFIVGLEKDYPSTISAIARTCGKLASKGSDNGLCALCQRPVQSGVSEWKDSISIRSFAGTDHPSAVGQVEISPQPEVLTRNLTPHLCYSCHTTLTSRSSRTAPRPDTQMAPAPLPVWTQSLLSSPSRRLGEEEMMAKFANFLIEE